MSSTMSDMLILSDFAGFSVLNISLYASTNCCLSGLSNLTGILLPSDIGITASVPCNVAGYPFVGPENTPPSAADTIFPVLNPSTLLIASSIC